MYFLALKYYLNICLCVKLTSRRLALWWSPPLCSVYRLWRSCCWRCRASNWTKRLKTPNTDAQSWEDFLYCSYVSYYCVIDDKYIRVSLRKRCNSHLNNGHSNDNFLKGQFTPKLKHCLLFTQMLLQKKCFIEQNESQ